MSTGNELRNPVELSASKLMANLQGRLPSIDELANQHPDSSNAVRELMPDVKLLERTRVEQESRTAPKHSLPEFARPEQLAEFRIGRELGRGGMGGVFGVEQVTLARTVALKVIFESAPTNDTVDAQLQDEARTTAKLHHSNIVPVYSAGRQGPYNYLAMECISGASLHRVINQLRQLAGDAKPVESGRENDLSLDSSATSARRLALMLLGLIPKAESSVPSQDDSSALKANEPMLVNAASAFGIRYWRNAADLIRQATSALNHAYKFQILHRDVKPSNLLLDLTGRLWVSDFGLAASLEKDGSIRALAFGGTLRYMAPERFQGQCDARSDVYSLGCTLYELVTLKPVRPCSLIAGETSNRSANPRSINERIPRDLEAIILKAMAVSSADRYPTAASFGADLVSFLEHRPVSARPIAKWEQGARWCKRNPIIAALMTLVASSLLLMALITTVALIFTRQAEEQVKASLRAATLQTERAERVASVATDALDGIFTELAPANLTADRSVPRNSRSSSRMSFIYSSQSVALLKQLYQFYDQLSNQSGVEHDLISRMAEAQYRIGRTCYAIGQVDQSAMAYEESVRLFRFASSIDANQSKTLYSLVIASLEAGDVYWAQGKYTTAGEEYKQLLMAYTNNPSHPFPWRGDEQQLQHATTLLRNLVQERPDEPKYQYLLAQCLCEQSAELQLMGEFVDIDERIELLRNGAICWAFVNSDDRLHD